LELKFGGDGLLVDIQTLSKGILKIINFMWCGSPQNALCSAYILYHIKYYFQVFLGE